mmetsp:Transcript_49859/g.154051  ORF Transcript_49859/g.154051 Transcript_49859/m.154051 type:complete len:249 (+) Transcript_49859:554-1300(+)
MTTATTTRPTRAMLVSACRSLRWRTTTIVLRGPRPPAIQRCRRRISRCAAASGPSARSTRRTTARSPSCYPATSTAAAATGARPTRARGRRHQIGAPPRARGRSHTRGGRVCSGHRPVDSLPSSHYVPNWRPRHSLPTRDECRRGCHAGATQPTTCPSTPFVIDTRENAAVSDVMNCPRSWGATPETARTQPQPPFSYAHFLRPSPLAQPYMYTGNQRCQAPSKKGDGGTVADASLDSQGHHDHSEHL